MRIDLNKQLLESLLVMGHLIEARDAHTGGHVWRVSEFARLAAEKLGLGPEEVFVVGLGGILHDVGKVSIPDAVLAKPGALTAEEYSVVKQHPVIGRDLMERHPMGPLVLDIIAGHHERVDGKGYPDRKGEENLSIHTRIVSVADAFDAMTSSRPYRGAMSVDKAMDILRSEKGAQFDAKIVEAFEGLERSRALDPIVGNTDYDRPLGVCPVHGETIVVPRSAVDGDIVYCSQCKGKFRLHISGGTFELEFTNTFQPDLMPVIEIDRIDEYVAMAPQLVAV
jgi:HD-GYP domain-containing protein (c-di-GMP phosphodiesterase class II)